MQHSQRHGPPAVSHAGKNDFDTRTTASQKIALVQQFALFSGIASADCTNILSTAHEDTSHADKRSPSRATLSGRYCCSPRAV
jgi:hypothetical protein